MIELKEGDVFEGQIEFTRSGNASLTVQEKEIFIYKKNTSNSLHLDKVKVEIFKGEKKLEGKVIETISRFKKEFVGRVQIGKKTTFVVLNFSDSFGNVFRRELFQQNTDQKIHYLQIRQQMLKKVFCLQNTPAF